MPVNPQDNMKVEINATQPQGPQEPRKPSAKEIADDLLKQRMGTTAGIDPATLQVLMSLMQPVLQQMQANNLEGIKLAIHEMRKPTPEEEAKLFAEKERQKNRSIQAAKAGELEAQMILDQQTRCTHSKPNGAHTFRGQVHANGWAEIKCIRCYVKFNVRPLPEHIASGLNLGDTPGLTIEHLRQWQKNSAEIDRRIRASQMAMLGSHAGVRGMAVPVGASGI